MQRTEWRRIVFGVAGVAILTVTVVAGRGAQAQEPDVLSALLVEVRGLRAAMEQMASAGPRVQLALGRLQLQEQRINTLVRRHESVRDALAGAQRELVTSRAQIEMVEKAMKQGTAGDEAPQMLEMSKTLRQALTAMTAEVQRLQGEEAALQQQIAEEQGRWSDINRALEELERALARR